MIGINSQIETGGSGGGSVGIGFAVPINTAKSEIAQLEKGGTVRGAYLGLTSLTIDGSLSALNLPGQDRRARAERAAGHRGRQGRHQRRHDHRHRKRPGRRRRRHHRLGRRQSDQRARKNSRTRSAPRNRADTVTLGLKRATGNGGYENKTVTVTLGRRPDSVPNPNTPEG